MTTITDLATGQEVLPGTIGLTAISGRAGALIRLGQWLAENPFIRWLGKDTDPDLQHAIVYLGDGQIIEAEPGGARIRLVTEYAVIYWCLGIAGQFTTEELAGVAATARTFERVVGYSFLDYFALAARRLRLYPLYPVLKRYIKATGHMICSALADAPYRLRGLEVFTDGRWPGDVMPMDLYWRDQALRKPVPELAV